MAKRLATITACVPTRDGRFLLTLRVGKAVFSLHADKPASAGSHAHAEQRHGEWVLA